MGSPQGSVGEGAGSQGPSHCPGLEQQGTEAAPAPGIGHLHGDGLWLGQDAGPSSAGPMARQDRAVGG